MSKNANNEDEDDSTMNFMNNLLFDNDFLNIFNLNDFIYNKLF